MTIVCLWAVAVGSTFWIYSVSEFPYIEVWLIWLGVLTLTGLASAQYGRMASRVALGTVVGFFCIDIAGLEDFVTSRLLALMPFTGLIAYVLALGLDMLKFALWGRKREREVQGETRD